MRAALSSTAEAAAGEPASLDLLDTYLDADRALPAAHQARGAGARAPHRARRRGRQAADGRVQPAPGRLDRQALPRAGRRIPRPDPGRDARADPRRREVRLAARPQVLDVRDVVDPAGGAALRRKRRPRHPAARAPGERVRADRPRPARARGATRPRATVAGSRPHAAHGRRDQRGDPMEAAGNLDRHHARRRRTSSRNARRRHRHPPTRCRRRPRRPRAPRRSRCSRRRARGPDRAALRPRRAGDRLGRGGGARPGGRPLARVAG